MQGKTVLYVPNEGLNISAEEASRNKEYVQRLESKLHISHIPVDSILTVFVFSSFFQ